MSNANFRTTSTDLWARPTWRNLTVTAQHLYLLLWTHPALTTAGTMDYNPTRLATLAADLTPDSVDTALDSLIEADLAAVDRDTQELALLGWWQDSTVLGQPYMTKNAIGKLNQTASTHILTQIAHTLHTIKNTNPTLNGLQTTEAINFLNNFVTNNTPQKTPPKTPRHTKPELTWVGHPDTVDDPADVRCRIHAGWGGSPAWCGVCAGLRGEV